MDDVRETLDRRIQESLENLNDRTRLSGSDRSEMVKEVATLYNLRLEEMKLEQKKDAESFARKYKLGLETASIVIPSATVLYSVIKGFQFEKEGTIVSSTMRRVLNYVKPDRIVKFLRF